MAASNFMQISDVPGDATEQNHEKWIVIQSMTWGVERAVDMTDLGSSQRSHANSNFQKVEISTELGLASTKLMLSVANGTVRPEIICHQCRSGESASDGLEPYLIWKLKDVQIDSYSVDMSEDAVPTESITLAYRSIEVSYSATDAKTNKLSKVDDFKWNLEKGMVG